MPRNPEQNTQVRRARKMQICSAALSVYLQRGYHGTDMDAVAEEAQLAKGLVYYYYKTKNALFIELFALMFDKGSAFSDALLKKAENMEPVRRLIAYTYGMFSAGRDHPRMMRFFLRAPFDAFAVFGPERWSSGAGQSKAHSEAVAAMIQSGIELGSIPPVNAANAANSFWSVFVANLFDYAKLIEGIQGPSKNEADIFQEAVRFCFQGLGIDRALWVPCLDKVIAEMKKGGPVYEGL